MPPNDLHSCECHYTGLHALLTARPMLAQVGPDCDSGDGAEGSVWGSGRQQKGAGRAAAQNGPGTSWAGLSCSSSRETSVNRQQPGPWARLSSHSGLSGNISLFT